MKLKLKGFPSILARKRETHEENQNIIRKTEAAFPLFQWLYFHLSAIMYFLIYSFQRSYRWKTVVTPISKMR